MTKPTIEEHLEVQQADDVLVQAARQGDAEAFGMLIKRHRQFCMKVAMLIVRNRTDAEDVLQNAFAKAWQRLWQYTGRGAFPAWLQRIVSFTHSGTKEVRSREELRPLLILDLPLPRRRRRRRLTSRNSSSFQASASSSSTRVSSS